MKTLGEVFKIYDDSLRIQGSNVENLDGDYLKDEEVAFKNAVFLHSKAFYEASYQSSSDGEMVSRDYFSTLFSQKPFVDEIIPVVDQTYISSHLLTKNKRRYFFSFLLDTEALSSPDVKSLNIDNRIACELLRRVIAARMNQIGINARQFYSQDLKKVFMVLKCQDGLLRIMAEVSRRFALYLPVRKTTTRCSWSSALSIYFPWSRWISSNAISAKRF